jgi:spermidine/putrescine transport system permease protein
MKQKDERAAGTGYGLHLSAGGQQLRAAITSGPGILWLSLFLLMPFAILGGISFLSRGDYGEITRPVTWESYKRLLGFGVLGFDPLYPAVLLRSLILGVTTAAICLVAGLPLAIFIARLSSRLKTIALVLVVIPFWTNLLIRTYAWQVLLSAESPLSKAAALVGLLKSGESLYPGVLAVLVGMICDFLPFMVLPLYASVEKLDWHLAEAAMDLGANRLQVLHHAIYPQIAPGVFAGTILVLLPAMGQFVVPDLLGGARTLMLGNAIQQQFGPSRDWPFGSALAFVALGLVMLGLWLVNRKSPRNDVELI